MDAASPSATIRQVAARAGVSIATVSRTLRHPEKVSADTREKVMEAVRAANFVPNAQARNFRRQRANSVILLVRDIANPFYLEIFKGVEEAASDAACNVLMGDAREDEARVAHFIDMVRARHADGLILMVGSLPPSLREAADLPPIVIVSETFPALHFPTVKVDNVAAAADAVSHLCAAGHRRIAHLSGPEPEQLARERFEGYRAALERHGLPFDPALVVEGDYGIEAGHRCVAVLAERGARYSALFASSDLMAIGAINELRRRGRVVPHDVSVIGFDDIVLAKAAFPALTTVRQPRREMGQAAMRLMVDLIRGREAPSREITLETELILRDTVGAAPEDGKGGSEA